MNYTKLKKDDFISLRGGGAHVFRPMLRVKYSGLIAINRCGARHLEIKKDSFISFCSDKSSQGCFAVMKDNSGWQLRPAICGQLEFNNVKLARHILDATWEREGHAVGAAKPKSMTFHIALLPLDEDKNKNVFALIQKKDLPLTS